MNVCNADGYRAAVDKIKAHANSLMVSCKSYGLRIPSATAKYSIEEHFPADLVKFFLRERQKMLGDLCNTERAGRLVTNALPNGEA